MHVNMRRTRLYRFWARPVLGAFQTQSIASHHHDPIFHANLFLSVQIDITPFKFSGIKIGYNLI